MDFGLIGFPLKHSFSKEIHSLFADYKYDLFELEENEIDSFFKKKNFKGINVTIPYKQKVMLYLDEIEENAKKINAINTIVNENGFLRGYNTDFYGVAATLMHYKINVPDYNFLILGTGATSNTIEYTLNFMGAKEIKKAYRESSKIKGDILYDDIDKYYNHFNFIINSTPNGMFPHIDDKELIDIKKFKDLKFVMDVIYNPLKTRLLLEAEKIGATAISGLYMLVAQAVFAGKYFTKSDSNLSEFTKTLLSAIKSNHYNYFEEQSDKLISNIPRYYDECLKSKLNIVLTGMPTCGKSSLGKMISKKYDYEFIDTDELIENKINGKIVDYINANGEEKFRDIESEVIKEICTKNHAVISTGGGAILRNENVDNLKLNGKIFFINRSLELLKPSSDRPLTSSIDSLTKKYNERLPIYKKTCDVEINGNTDYDTRISNILNNL